MKDTWAHRYKDSVDIGLIDTRLLMRTHGLIDTRTLMKHMGS